MAYTVEICCGSYADVRAAELAGADRVELCSALSLGGLTPSVAALRLAKENCKIPVIAMVRPRAAGFCYLDEEFNQALAEARSLLEAGADGLAFGFVTEDFQIDVEKTKKLVELCQSAGKEAVFHRAFDLLKDPIASIKKLIELGVDRLLTSGQKATAAEGVELLAKLQASYGDKIEILAGCGVTLDNVDELIRASAVTQVHSSCTRVHQDLTTNSDSVSYAYLPDSRPGYEAVSAWIARKFIHHLHNEELN